MNRTNVLTALAVLGAIALVIWIARNTYWDDVKVPQPLRGDAATNPFYAAEHFARSLGANTRRPKHVRSLSRDSDVLVLANWNWSLIPSRRLTIERWVENGGRLVLDGRLVESDTRLRDWSGLSRARVLAGGKPVGSADAESIDEVENGCGPITIKHDVEGVSGGRHEYRVCTLPVLRALLSKREPQWSLVDGEGYQAVRVPVGRGSVTWLNAAPFLYRDLMAADHGLLFVAATQLQAGDTIMFMSEEDQLSLLALIWKHGAPVVLLLIAWLAAALWRSGVRFGPSAPVALPIRRSLAEQIRGTSEFTRRFGGGRALHAAAVRAVNESAEQCIPRYYSMDPAHRFDALSRLTGIDAERLAETINYSGPRSRHELKKALELIEHVRRRLESNSHRSTMNTGETVHGS
ncbi:MAG TPA: DUF4350 domain-containing protein [Steroidobacteraceae bacterium]|nr:DUF4350 domain-containing protein [Steroidobacteraceae bacterium]